MSLIWTQEPLDQQLAKHLRRDIRTHRRERGRDGHRYVFKDLKEINAGRRAGEVAFAVLAHREDPVWQLYAWHPDEGWLLTDWFGQRHQARKAAEGFSWPVEDSDVEQAGTYVVAGFAQAPYRRNPSVAVHYSMRVRCRTKNTAITISEIFHHLGCDTMREEVS